MSGVVRGTLQRWRDNYYLSHLLASVAKPLHFPLAGMAKVLQRRIRRNGFTLRLPNGKNLIIGRDTCIDLASLLFWHGLDGFEPIHPGPYASFLNALLPLLMWGRTAVFTRYWAHFGTQSYK